MSKPKTPTASGISRLLAKAGYTRAVIKIRGGKAGYSATTDLTTGNVRVEYNANTMGNADYSRDLNLAAYARAITEAGYEVARPSPRWLLVTAKED